MPQTEPQLLQHLREAWKDKAGWPDNVIQVIEEIKEVSDPRIIETILALIDNCCEQWFLTLEGIPGNGTGILTVALQAIAQWRGNDQVAEHVVNAHYQEWSRDMNHFMSQISTKMSVDDKWRYQTVFELEQQARRAVKGKKPVRLGKAHYQRFFPWMFDGHTQT